MLAVVVVVVGLLLFVLVPTATSAPSGTFSLDRLSFSIFFALALAILSSRTALRSLFTAGVTFLLRTRT